MTPTQTPHRYDVDAESTRGGAAQATTNGRTIRFDASATQAQDLPGPADLMTAAFAACILKNVERFSEILPFRYEHARIHVTSERQDAPPRMTRIRYVLTIVTDEDAQRVDLLHRNIKGHGTIYNTLAAVCDVDGAIHVLATAQASAWHEHPTRAR
ncbi:MAG: OsmC family protein [Actinomycetota bacterium]